MESKNIHVSCPGRVDIGNTLDLPSHFFSMRSGSACTVNIAIDLRIKVYYHNNPNSYILIKSNGITENSKGLRSLSDSKFPLIWIMLNHFSIANGTFEINSDIPRGSGLGGSGALVVSLVSLILRIKKIELTNNTLNQILIFCHLFENWLGFSSTGFHDQLAAIFGGANLWKWGINFEKNGMPYQRESLINTNDVDLLNERMILAYTGETHQTTTMGLHIGRLNDYDLNFWHHISRITEDFSTALKNRDWEQLGELLNQENEVRCIMDPKKISNRVAELIEIAKTEGVGSRFVGHGYGGCVWAIGNKDKINNTINKWQLIINKWPNAWVKYPKVAERGLVIDEN